MTQPPDEHASESATPERGVARDVPRHRDPTGRAEELLESSLERFSQVAPLDEPRQLLEFLPERSPEGAREILLELIKLDLSAALEQGKSRRIEDYSRALPEYLPLDRVPFDLVLEEMQLRREQRQETSPKEYAARFPHCAKLLGQVEKSVMASSKKHRGLPDECDVGSQIDDFLIIRALGKGAFARVYLAKQISMQRLVALKISCGTGGESQTLAQLDHGNIVRVFDQRVVAGGDLHLLYMQYVPGGTLSDVVRAVRAESGERLSGELVLRTVDRNLLSATQEVPERSSVRRWLSQATWPVVVAWMGVQLARALDEAHRRGVLHRDIKPANVSLSSEGIPKLADFNISFAAALNAADDQPGLGGSLAYMSPEHLQAIMPESDATAEDVREPADLYSLGVLLWELWQGHRPFTAPRSFGPWSDLVKGQLASRGAAPDVLAQLGDGSERVLQQTLRQTISSNARERPASGAELAGRLRLALHPETAALFDPEERSWTARLLKLSPWLTAATVILVPNIAAGVFNYFYNWAEIITKWNGTQRAEITDGFWTLALCVNSVAYPLGAALMIWFTRPVAAAVAAAKDRKPVDQESLDVMMRLGHRAAWIGGAIWGAASIIYPAALSVMYRWFPLEDALHFFVSLVICGGIAAVYPYFGMTVLATRVYYPRMLRNSMQDPQFERRRQNLGLQSARFLLAAAGIPLLALALLLAVEELARWVMAWAVAATALGLIAAFRAYLCVQRNWSLMANVLSTSPSPLD